MEDLSNMLEPPMMQHSIVAGAQDQNEGSEFNHIVQEGDKVRGLEQVNRRLETELQLMKQVLEKQQESQFNNNLDHFSKIQELFNKVQVENKGLKVNNKKIESQLESKERLIKHLE